MGKLAFLFPGQGSQRVGMGAELQKNEPELFDRYLGAAGAAAQLPIAQYCLEGPLETLTRTEIAQPALFAVSLALADYAGRIGLRPNCVAGHSLGEYTAAVACGALQLEDGMRLVSERGRQMAGAQSERPGTMAAVLGLPPERLAELCRAASSAGLVELANINTPSQIVVSGEKAGVEKLTELATAAGAQRVVALQVGAAFHSALMKPVQDRLARQMAELSWSDGAVPLASNSSGRLVQRGAEVRGALIAQIASPVQWVACIEALAAAGCTLFLELGPGRVLTGLVRQILTGVETAAADSPQKLQDFLRGHPELAAHS